MTQETVMQYGFLWRLEESVSGAKFMRGRGVIELPA